MGIMINKEDENVKLTERINADLRTSAMATSDEDFDGDYVESSAYTKELVKTSRFSWIWIVLVALAIISLVFIIMF